MNTGTSNTNTNNNVRDTLRLYAYSRSSLGRGTFRRFMGLPPAVLERVHKFAPALRTARHNESPTQEGMLRIASLFRGTTFGGYYKGGSYHLTVSLTTLFVPACYGERKVMGELVLNARERTAPDEWNRFTTDELVRRVGPEDVRARIQESLKPGCSHDLFRAWWD